MKNKTYKAGEIKSTYPITSDMINHLGMKQSMLRRMINDAEKAEGRTANEHYFDKLKAEKALADLPAFYKQCQQVTEANKADWMERDAYAKSQKAKRDKEMERYNKQFIEYHYPVPADWRTFIPAETYSAVKDKIALAKPAFEKHRRITPASKVALEQLPELYNGCKALVENAKKLRGI